MTKTELLNKTAQNPEERMLLARALDKLELARQRGVPACTGFLSPQERLCLERLLQADGHPRHLFFGGFEGAERTICAFLPDWQEEADWLEDEDCPVCCLRCSFPEGSNLAHPDFLGSILGLGITREKLGDLLVGETTCDLIVLREIAEFLLLHLESAGRTHLKVNRFDLADLAPQAVELKIIRDTVATLRFDAVAASAFSMARGKASDLISGGKIQLNHAPCIKTDRAIAQGDVLTARGLGKCVVKTVGGLSKKGRINIELERYV
ncbi:MAG: YlmH/Sll1252 family protein [Pseudoflavonifractor sp.]